MRTQYIVDLSSNAGLNPPIMTFFKTIPEGSYEYNYYNLRHPGGIYNLTTTRLINSIENLVAKLAVPDGTDVYNYLRLVLYDLFKFYDACYEIMQCFTLQHPEPSGFVHVWLKSNGYQVGQQFFNSIKNDDDFKYLKDLYNALKHTSSEVRQMMINNGEGLIWGYWLQIGNGNNGLVPLNSTLTSLNLELRRIQYLIYKISANLHDALTTHFQDVHGVVWQADPTLLPDVQFASLHNIILGLPELFLYNEAGSTFWKSSYNPGSAPTLVFDPILIDQAALNALYYQGRQIMGNHIDSGDGFTRSFTFPHLGLADNAAQVQVIDNS